VDLVVGDVAEDDADLVEMLLLPSIQTLACASRGVDILAFFDHPGTSNGHTEAINSRLEHLRGSAPGFRSIDHHIARSILDTGGFRPPLHPKMRRAR